MIVTKGVIYIVNGLPQIGDRWFRWKVVLHQVHSDFLVAGEMIRGNGKGALRIFLSEL